MSVLEMVIMVGFGVPIIVLCCAFALCASFMQMQEDQTRRQNG